MWQELQQLDVNSWFDSSAAGDMDLSSGLSWSMPIPLSIGKGEREMKTIFLDRDGVINRNRPQGDYVKNWEEFQFLPGSCEAIARLTQAGFRLLVVTNQACVGKGIVSWAMVQEIHARMVQEIARAGGWIEAVLCCPHLADAGCGCRKPQPGLLRRAYEEYRVDLRQAILVGDSATDMQTAAAVGIPAIMVLSGLGHIADLRSASLPYRFALDLACATQIILDSEVLPPDVLLKRQ